MASRPMFLNPGVGNIFLLHLFCLQGYNRQNLFMEECMESPQPVLESPTKKNQTPLIIAAVAIVLCCCCVLLAVVGYFGYTRMQSRQVIPLQPTEEPVLVNPTDVQTSPG